MDYKVTCPGCRSNIGLQAVQVGQPIRCPYCKLLFLSSDIAEHDRTTPTGRLFTFSCVRCRSGLEAYSSMIGQRAQCPSCGVHFFIPEPGREAAPAEEGQELSDDRQPVHAYASAGENAPAIARDAGGAPMIRCPRCSGLNPLVANRCAHCGTPFSIDGTEIRPTGDDLGFAIASVVLGVISIPASLLMLPGALAVVFGALALRRGRRGMRFALAVTGITLGAVSFLYQLAVKMV